MALRTPPLARLAWTLSLLVAALVRSASAATTVTWSVRYEDAPDLGGQAYVVSVDGGIPIFDGLATASTAANVTTYTILATPPLTQWYGTTISLTSAASLPAPFNILFANATAYPLLYQLAPTLYMAADPAQSPYVVYFGGQANSSAFVCLWAPQLSTGTIECGNATTTDPDGTLAAADLWMSVAGVTATAVNVNATVTAASTTPLDAVLGGALAIASSRLATQYSDALTMDTTQDANAARRASAEYYVVALFLLLAWAMLWHIILVSILLSWAVPMGRFWGPQGAFVFFFVLTMIVQLILTLTLGLLGWAIGGILFGLIEVVILIILVVVRANQHCRPAEYDAEVMLAEQQDDEEDDEDAEAIRMKNARAGRTAADEAGKPELPPRSSWSVQRMRFGHTQWILAVVSTVMVLVAIAIFLIVGVAWETEDYYVYDRQTGTYVVEVQPVTVSKSTLAIYTIDGAATALQMNIFLVTFTSLCGTLYRTELSTYADKYQAIYVNYVSQYNINMSQFSPSDWTNYSSVNDFFIRPLQAGARPIAFPDNALSVASPADARVYAFSPIPADWSFVIKDETFTLGTLLNNNTLAAASFNGGVMFTVRLAPQDYHRFHAPVSGTIVSITNVSGTIYSVNADAVLSQNLVYYNERSVVIIETEALGPVAFVAIGATCVGSIVLLPETNTTITKGEEIGRFEFGGSTILLIFGPNTVMPAADLVASTQSLVETYVNMGTELGRAST